MMKNLLIVVTIVAVGIGAYYVGTRQSVSPPASDAVMPAAHPRVNAPDPNEHFTHFRVGESNVKSILADGEIIWVGTSGGVIRYDTTSDSYKLYDNRTGLLANGIFHLSKLDGQVVAGTYGGGLSILDEQSETWKTYNIPDGLGDGFIYDVLKLDNGDVWIATWSGVNRVRGGDLDDRSKWDLYTVANTNGGLPNDWVYALQAGEDGAVWLATEGGLSHFADGEWQSWGHADGLGAKYEVVKSQIEFRNDPAQYSEHHARQKEEMGLQDVDVAFNPNYIVALLVDRDGTVWAGTWGGGLSRFDGENWKVYTVVDGLPGNHVFMLHQDDQGQLWIGTNNGLARMDDGSFKKFTTADGLYSNRVFAMTTGADGSRWIGSFGGVARVTSLD
jgi:ligand-binding sensor domain-containing protein